MQQILCLGMVVHPGPSRSPAQTLSHQFTWVWLLLLGQLGWLEAQRPLASRYYFGIFCPTEILA